MSESPRNAANLNSHSKLRGADQVNLHVSAKQSNILVIWGDDIGNQNISHNSRCALTIFVQSTNLADFRLC